MRIRNIKQVEDSMPTAVLAGGYSSDRQMPAQFVCLNQGNTAYSGNSKSVVAMGSSVSFDQISQQLNVDVSGGANIGVFSTSLQAQYARYIQDNAYTSSFYFYTAIQLPTQVWNPTSYGIDVLSSYGAGVYNYSLPLFRENCGDQFVQQIHLGASLFATLKVNFNSKYDKTIFTEQSSSSFLGITYASSEIQEVSVKYNLTGVMELSAMQIGGQAGNLAQIFNNATDAGYYISHCQIQDVSACNSLINSILSYSSGNFVSQIDFQNGGVVGNAAPLSYDLGDYTDLGLHATESIITPNITEARARLTNAYQESLHMASRIDHLLNSGTIKYMHNTGASPANHTYLYWDSSQISPEIDASLQTGYNAVIENINILINPTIGAITCFYTPSNCTTLQENILHGLVDPSQYNTTLTQFSVAYLYQVNGKDSELFYALPIGNNNFLITPFSWFFLGIQISDQWSVVNDRMEIANGSFSIFVENISCDEYPILTGKINGQALSNNQFLQNCCTSFAAQHEHIGWADFTGFARCQGPIRPGSPGRYYECSGDHVDLSCSLFEIDNPII